MNRKVYDVIGLLISWFAVIAQFVLMLQNRQADILETIIRFFSFFTILTNTLVALYFTVRVFKIKSNPIAFLNKIGSITAITVFILLVGIVYQVVLRSIWKPEGLQKIVDEFLHTIIPLFVLIYWLIFSKREDTNFNTFKIWLIYPFFYFIFITIRGFFTEFYPYPFVNIKEIGLLQTGINFVIITMFIFFLFVTLFLISHKLKFLIKK